MKDKSTLFNPFPGLRSFRSDEDHLFFGREEQALELIARLQRNRFIAVVGSSGRGKSSLVRCGLLSRLQGGGMLEAGAHWEIAVMHPGGDPLRHLADALLEAGLYDRAQDDAQHQLLATLGRSQFGLIQAVRQAALPAGSNFLLVVDQFEEIFRFEEAGEAESEVANDFIAMLREATAQTDVAIYVVATMRSDFIGDCSRFEGLAEAVNRGEYLIPGLNRDQFKSAIEGPIRVAGGQITSRLMQRLLNDLGDEQDQLPCLQHALMRTWRVWQGRPDAVALDLEDYAQVGKMSQALSVHADEVYFGLATDRQRERCAAMFKALTVEGSEKRGIRRPRRLQALCRILGVEKAELLPVIDAFRHPEVSFLMPPADNELRDTTVIDLSHESLMRVWSRLRDWVDEEAKSVGIFRRLSESAALWRQGKTGFYRDPELSIARAWAESSNPNAAWAEQYEGNFEDAVEFLHASTEETEKETRRQEAARQRELEQARALAEAERRRAEEQTRFAGRLKWLVRGLGLVAMVAVAAMLLAIAARRQAQANAELARQNESRATEHARVAQEQKRRADAQAEKFRNQIYKVQLLRADTAMRQFNGGAAFGYLQECEESLRNWEWRRLAYRSNHSVHSAKLYERYFSNVRFSPDGQQILSTSFSTQGFKASNSSTLETLWDATVAGFSSAIWGLGSTPVAFSRDGRQIIARNRAVIEFWDVARRQKTRELADIGTPFELLFSRDGQSIWTVQAGPATVNLRDAATGEVRKTFNGPPGSLLAFALSPDERTMVAGSMDGTIRIWETDKPDLPRVLPSQRSWVQSFAFSPNGQIFVSGDREGSVRLHSAATGLETKAFADRFRGEVRSIAFSPDGRLLAAAGGSTIKLWDADSHEELAFLFGHDGDIRSIAFAPDGRSLASGDASGILKLWSTDQGFDVQELRGHTGQLREGAFNRSGDRLVSGGFDGTVRIWDVATGQELRALNGHRGSVTAAAISPDGRQIASGGNDEIVRLWDVTSGTISRTLRGHHGAIWWATYSPDGTVLATGGVGGELKLWDTSSGTELRSIKASENNIEGIRFSPDGKMLAISEGVSGAGRIRTWNVATGEVMKTYEGAKGYYSRNVVFSPDGRFIAVGTVPDAMIWNVATGEARTLKAQGGRIQAIAFSPDGKRLFGAGERGFISVWDLATGDEILIIDSEQGPIWALHVSPDGSTLASSGASGVIRLWETVRPSDEASRKRRLISAARRIVDERSQGVIFAADVIASLRSDPGLRPELRDQAVQIVETRGDNPNTLLDACWNTLRNAKADDAALGLALRQAETAAKVFADEIDAQRALGLAHFRCGNFAEALAAAERSDRLAQEQTGKSLPLPLLVKAMAHFRLGTTDKARTAYAEARALFPPDIRPNSDLKFVAEMAEQLMR